LYPDKEESVIGLVAQWVTRATLIYEENARLINPDPGNPKPSHWNIPNGEHAIEMAFDLLFKDGKSALMLLAELQDLDEFQGLFAPHESEDTDFVGCDRFEIGWLEFVRYVLFVQYKEFPGLQNHLFPAIDAAERELWQSAQQRSADTESIQFVPIPA
jgi:hypothetical protein